MSKGGGAAYLKKINRSKIVRGHYLNMECISRADISKVTGINKATISAQVAELLEEELVCEKEIEYNQVGSPSCYQSTKSLAMYWELI